MNSQPNPRWLLTVPAVMACITIAGFVLTHREALPPAPAVILLKKPYTIPTQKIGFLDRVMPTGPSWGWLWRVRYALFGKIRAIDITTTIIDINGLDVSAITPIAEANLTTEDGLQIWRIEEAGLNQVQQVLKEKPDQILNSPRVATGNQIRAAIQVGSSIVNNGTVQPLGINADFLPLLRKDTLELTAIFLCTAATTNLEGAVSIRTNLDVAGRFNLPQTTSGIFILSATPRSPQEKRLALLMTSKVQRPKK